MTIATLARRLEKLEAAQQPSDPDNIASMNVEQLREYLTATLEDMGGKAAVLAALRDDPGSAPETIKMFEDWSA
jgi:hypothetical protein